MQVFICDFNIYVSASILDNKRLNKQIVEAYQILTDRLPNFNHPAYLYWRNYKQELSMYLYVLSEEYTKRFNRVHSCSYLSTYPINNTFSYINNFDLLHLSHKVNLLRKDIVYYSRFYNITNLDTYPVGYYWICPYGRSSITTTNNWIDFYNT